MSEIQIKQILIHQYKALDHVSNEYNELLLEYIVSQKQLSAANNIILERVNRQTMVAQSNIYFRRK